MDTLEYLTAIGTYEKMFGGLYHAASSRFNLPEGSLWILYFLIFSEEDITRLADTFTAFQNGTLQDQKGFCAAVTTKDIAVQAYPTDDSGADDVPKANHQLCNHEPRGKRVCDTRKNGRLQKEKNQLDG